MIVKTLKQLAAACQRNQRTVEKWKTEPGFPMLPPDNPEGQYDTEAILNWRATRDKVVAREKQTAEDLADARELRNQRIRALKIKNDEAEAEVLRKQGKLAPEKTIQELLGTWSHHIKNAIRALRRRGHVNEARTVEEALQKAKKSGDAIIDRAIRESQK